MKEKYSHEMNWFQKALGIWRINRDSIDFKWGSFTPAWAFVFQYHLDYEDCRPSIQIGILWGEFYLKVPFTKGGDFDFDKYDGSHKGFYWFEDSFVMQWNKWSKHIEIPFISYEFEWHKVLNKYSEWVNYEYDDNSTAKESHPYTYKLNSGEIQERTATCYRDKRQWHRKWAPFLKVTKECIDISFDDEVGERSGSYKGGTTGCGYDLLKGESIKDCLSRMQSERKF